MDNKQEIERVQNFTQLQAEAYIIGNLTASFIKRGFSQTTSVKAAQIIFKTAVQSLDTSGDKI